MNRRSLLVGSLAVACGEDDDMRRSNNVPSHLREPYVPPVSHKKVTYMAPPGYDSTSPAGCVNVVCIGDSITQGVGDLSGQGGYPYRLLNYLVPTYGANKFRFRGTNPVRGYLSTHFTEGHGGYSIENLTEALDNKPISGNPTGQRMFGVGGYHQNTHLVISAVGANNMNDYNQTVQQLDTAHRTFLWKLRNMLNENNTACKIAVLGSYLDWGGISQNHDKVVAGNAVFDQMIADFNAAFPTQTLVSGYKWYDALGPYDPAYYASSIVHPNELGYDRVVNTPLSGQGMLTFLQPTFAALAA